MTWIVLALLAAGQDPAPPGDLEISSPRPFLVGDVPFTVTLRADDGPVEISGLVRVDADGRETPVASAVVQDGRVAIENVRLRGGRVTVRQRGRTAEWTPRVIPGFLSLVPPLVAIALAVATRQVLVALSAGIYVGVVFIHGYDPMTALLRTFDTHLLDGVAERSNVAILLFTMSLGGMVGVVGRSGGAKALVLALTRRVRSRRAAQLSAWLMGLAIFFDDYANCLLVGNTVRPYADSQRLSREKLSFIVDATAAPIASVALISTWIGYQLGQLSNTGVIPPAETYGAFLSAWPYSFYSLLMIAFVFMVAWTGRDFGPMLAAERRAKLTGKVLRDGAEPLMDRELTEMETPEEGRLRWWTAAVPVGTVIAVVIVGLFVDGWIKASAQAAGAGTAAEREALLSLRGIIGQADSYAVLLWASFGGSLAALLTALLPRVLTLPQAMDAWVKGCKSMVVAVLILALAWTLGRICREHLLTGPWVISLVSPPVHFLPLLVFLASAVIAFATGTSFGTMAIVFPIAGPMAWALTGDGAGLSEAVVHGVRYGTLGAVLTGAVFGDHCSPISDTTVMSSMAAASDHLDHVRTQAPYAVLVGLVAALIGFIPAGFGMPPWISLLAGVAALAAFLRFFGHPADAVPAA